MEHIYIYILKQDLYFTTKFRFWRQGLEKNMVVTSLQSLGQGETGSDISKH